MRPLILGYVYWANRRFPKPGLWIWTGRRARRIVAW
jgi:hypothetical protein